MTTKCQVCHGSGWVEVIGGDVQLNGGRTVTATPERPVYRRCKSCERHSAPIAPQYTRTYGDD